jgi:hypothetical protein
LNEQRYDEKRDVNGDTKKQAERILAPVRDKAKQ